MNNRTFAKLKEFLESWNIKLPPLDIPVVPEDEIHINRILEILPSHFLTPQQKFDPDIVEAVRRNIQDQNLSIYVGIPTYYGRGADGFYTSRNIFELLLPWHRAGLLRLFVSYQGIRANELVKWARKQGIEVIRVSKFSLVDGTGNAVIEKKQPGKTENYLLVGKYFLDRVANEGRDLEKCLLVMLDDDYVMYSLEMIFLLFFPWVLGKIPLESVRSEKLKKKCRFYRNLRLVKNGSSRLDCPETLRVEVKTGQRPVLEYRDVVLWCLEKEREELAQKMDAVRGLLKYAQKKRGRINTQERALKIFKFLAPAASRRSLYAFSRRRRRFLQAESRSEKDLDSLERRISHLDNIAKMVRAVPRDILLTPDNLERIFRNRRAVRTMRESLNRFMGIGGRVTIPVTEELARRSSKVRKGLSQFTYLLNGDDAVEFSLLRLLYLAPGYGLEITKMVQAILLAQQKQFPTKIANVRNWPHIHIPNKELKVAEMKMVVYFFLDFMLTYLGRESLDHFIESYARNVQKIARFRDGRIESSPWHMRSLRGQYLLYPPLKECTLTK